MTNAPTAINMALIGTLPTNRAAMGAAINPPTIRPATSIIGILFKRIKNVIELTNTTKNSARHTEPMTYRGLLRFDISVLVTSVPQPPPAKESIKPPADASHPALFTFESYLDFANAFL